MHNKVNFRSSTFKILLMFLTWRIVLVVIAILSISFLSLGSKDRFLGGGPINYLLLPEFFSWANFDGEHYLSISIFGYKYLEQAFFPVYPLLMAFFSRPDQSQLLLSLINSTIVGLIISNASFVLALIFLWELVRKDFSEKIAFITIALLMVFPTSFYFGAVYNESLFLLLSVLSFYFARRGNWLLAGTFGMVSSATRIFGILLLPALLIEAWQQRVSLKRSFWILPIPLGLGLYMMYQFLTVGDYFAFYHLQKLVGEQHQSGFTLLPQVYYRYIKMILTVNLQNPIFQTVLLEFVVGILFFVLPILGYLKKVRFSYLLYALAGFLTPTIQGSFSSVPRYVIVFFPTFIVAAVYISNFPRYIRLGIFLLLFLCLILETALFVRGYWVA